MGLGHAQRDVAITGELRRIHPDLEMGSSPSRPAPKQQDSYQVRRWRSWSRWTTLAMLAYAFWWWPRSPSTPATHLGVLVLQ